MLKVEFLTQDDPLYILPFFQELFGQYRSEFEITQVSSCQIMGARSRRKMLSELLALYRPWGFVRLASRAAVGKTLGWVPLRRSPSDALSMTQLCRALSIRYRHIGNPNDESFVSGLGARCPDLLVSVACPYILKEAALSLPRLACINIHHAPLPRFQGMMPTFWQLYHGQKTVGVTIHYMASKVDQGEAVLRDELAVEPGESLDHLIRRSKRHGAHCMASVIRRFANEGRVAALPSLHVEPSYFTFPTDAEIKEFHRRGYRGV
jgi:methionyl-tRNA formyltransferase